MEEGPFLQEGKNDDLSTKLEYFDLREIQEVICNRAVWERFAAMFGTKEGLMIKFTQIAELRNVIRHSRSVDEITRKEGEAAILWFEGCLRGGRGMSPVA
jgi:hypothetical protein